LQPESHISIDRDHLGRIGAMLEALQADRRALVEALGACLVEMAPKGPSEAADRGLALLRRMAGR
jgi:hypothetical protein